MRPEVMPLLVLVGGLVVVGYIAHRSIYFTLSEAASGLARHPCIFESRDKLGGDTLDWDFSPLIREETSCRSKDCPDR